ncbi:MAG: sortase [Anaerolineales bacterium]|jgi:LPXTG-site transpeptidase (sortase) family protein
MPLFISKLFLPIRFSHFSTRKTLAREATLAILFALLLVILNVAGGARAAGVLTVEIIAAPNLVVDSNVLSPSTYSPEATTVIGKFCNTGDTTLPNVQGFIGDFSGATPDSGNYPAYIPPASDTTFFGWGQDNGAPGAGFYFEHIGGSLGADDASRIIGDIPAGECATQYWHFTYPTIAYDGGGGRKPTWGDSVKPYDDLSLDFWIWGQTEGSSPVKTSHTMTMRNEISAMANKIEPNDGIWFNTDSDVVKVDEYIISNGINYDLGNINQGFDNDGDGDYDYNAWLQPFGNASFDPGCFQLVKTWGTLTLRRSGGQPDLVVPFEDQLYFTDEDYLAIETFDTTTITTGVGEVHYKFKALKSNCYVDLVPYQEVASGADNEKFNADFGSAFPGISSSEARIDIDKSGDVIAAGPSETIIYTLSFTNNTGTALEGLTLSTNPMPLTITDAIPDGTTYVLGSADATVPPAGTENSINTDIYYSSDGITWSTNEGAVSPIRHIQWWLDDTVANGATAYVKFQVAVDADYDPLPTGDGPVIENCMEPAFGGAGSFDEACFSTIYKGVNSITGLVWEDGDTDGVYESGIGEVVIPDVTVWLYLDLNEDGIIDDTDPLVMTDLDLDSDGNFAFNELPDGDFIVQVDTSDPDLPEGYSNTTPTQFYVDGLGVGNPPDPPNATEYVEFGFGPVFSLTKGLTSEDPTYDGRTVTFDIILQNLRPGDGQGGDFCSYTLWASAVDTDVHYGVNAGSRFVNMDNALGIPDTVYATTDLADSNDMMGLEGYNTSHSGNITKVELILYAAEVAPLERGPDDKLYIEVYYAAVSGSDPSFWATTINASDFTEGIGQQQIFTYDITSANQVVATAFDPTDDPWDWTHFSNDDIHVVAVSDKIGGTAGDMGIDGAGIRITTDDTSCSGSGANAITYLPLVDTYDGDLLQFVSANPPESAVEDTGSEPYDKRIVWNNLGPLYGGEIKTVTLTFKALDVAVSTLTTNAAVSDGGTLDNGELIHDPAFPPTDSDDVTIEPGGSIGDLVWVDSANYGVVDAGEMGIPGVTVELYLEAGGTDPLIATTTTDANGNYLFEGLAPADYHVYIDDATLPAGFDTATYDFDGISGPSEHRVTDITINGNDNDLIDFGYRNATADDNLIYGRVFEDVNGDGYQGTNEPAFSNVTVELYDCSGICTATGIIQTTDANGDYTFTGVPDDDYEVRITDTNNVLTGYTQTADPDQAGTCSGAGCNDQKDEFTAANSSIYGSYDFGYQLQGAYSVGDLVWEDLDGDNDSTDPLEIGINGVTVILYMDSNGDATVDPTTDAVRGTYVTGSGGGDPDGYYIFNNLPDDLYRIVVDETDIPAGYLQTGDPDEVGTCTTCDGQSDEFDMSTVDVAGTNLDFDFGYRPSGANTVGDLLFVDLDGNGNYEPTDGDYGINGGVQVELYKNTSVVSLASQQNSANPSFDTFDAANDPLISTTTIDVNGNYLFTGLPDGYYWVKVPSSVNLGGTDYFPSTTNPYSVIQVCVDGVYTNLAPNIDITTGAYDADYDGDGDTEPPPTDSNWCDAQSTDEVLGSTISDYEDADFGYTPGASVGDTIWLDTNRNGSKDDKDPTVFYEPGIEGVEVTLTGDVDGDGTIDILTDTTDANGNYLFDNLHPGSYTITVTDMSGALVGGGAVSGLAPTYDPDEGVPCSVCNETTSFTLTPGQYDPSRDFGYAPYATIGDTLWIDSYNQGTLDSGEARLPGVTVTLRDCSVAGLPNACEAGDPVVQTTITDENGEYAFAVYENKFYQVEVPPTVTIPDGTLTLITEPSPADAADLVNVSTPGAYLDSDFGYDSAGMNDLSGYVYYDVENIGIFDPGEPVFDNVTINLFIKVDDNGTPGDDTDDTWALFDSTQTDVAGYYEFTGLDGGDYRVQYDVNDSRLTGLGRTQPAGTYYEILNLSADTTDLNFGFRASSIGDLVWADADGEGDQDEVGAGIPNITVELYLDDGDSIPDPGGTDGAPIQTILTNANGEYLFYGLDAGAYFVRFVNPGNYAFSPKDATGDDATDSDADTTTGVTDVFALGTDEYQGTWDAGMVGPSITLDKDPDTQTVPSGGTASFTFSFTNDGGVPLTSVTPSDAQCTTALTQTANGNGDAILDVGEIWSYACDTVNVTADFDNTASVTAKDPLNNDVTASDTVSVTVSLFNPSLDLDKSPDNQQVVSGGTANFTITVENDGDVDLTSVVLTDTDCDSGAATPVDVAPVDGFNDGDTDLDNELDVGETWSYTCAMSGLTADDTNTVSVTAKDPLNNDVTDNETVNVDVIAPSLDLDKSPDNQQVVSGGSANFTIIVENDGDVDLTSVVLTDADCDGGAATPVDVAPADGFNDGDADLDNELDIGETWSYTCAMSGLTVDDTNTAAVTAKDPLNNDVTDNETVNVDVIAPSLDLDKSPNNQQVVSGGTANFTITVENDGDVDLTSVVLTDTDCDGGAATPVDVAPADGLNDGDADLDNELDIGETWSYTCAMSGLIVDDTNTASVTAKDPLNNDVTDNETVNVDVINPSVTLDKDPDTQAVPSGGTANFTFSFTNDGDVPLTNVTPSDAQCTTALTQTANGNGDAILDVAETWSYACSTVNVTVDFDNTASVTAKDPLNNDVTASDTVSVTVSGPGTGSIGDYVWNDADGEGDQDEGVGLSGVRVYLDLNGNGNYDPATENAYAVNTAADGSYTIPNVPAGTYQVRVDTSTLPSGFNQTGDPDEIGTCTICNSHHQVVLGAGVNYTGADFGYQQQDASIGDLIWNDQDGDGVRDVGEPGIANVRVYLDTSGDGSYQVGEPTDLTNASGIYTISGLAAGTYTVRVDTTSAALSGFGQTGDPDQLGVTCSACDNQQIVTLSAGEVYTAADFGYHEGPVNLSKTIFATDPGGVANTAGNDIAIGEIIVYQVEATFAPGTYAAATLTDILDQGLAYVGCSQADQSDGGLTIANFADLCANHVLVSRYPAASTSDEDDGRQVVFDLGDVENTSGGGQTLTLQYQVVVLNILQNNRGDLLSNSAYYDPLFTTSAPDVTIVEPALDIDKTADLSIANPGDLITFRIEISHTPVSNAHAYDVVVRDSIPAELIYEAGTLQPDLASPQQPTSLSISGGTDIEVTWDEFLDDGTTSAFTFQARMGAVPPGQIVTNTASVEWTSLLGDFQPGDPGTPISPHNTNWSFERWYDPADLTGLNGYGGITSSAIVRPPGSGAGGQGFELPGTGFAPGRITHIPGRPQALAYQSMGGVWLEIPSLNIKTSIVGIPLAEGGWDVTWLWNQVGHLEGTAFPTTAGNTVITGHVYLPNGLAGPFADLKQLNYGDEIIIHAYGQRYVYQLRERHLISPYNLSVFEHKTQDWLTLLTCSSYNEQTGSYRHRFYIQAILVSVTPDTS